MSMIKLTEISDYYFTLISDCKILIQICMKPKYNISWVYVNALCIAFTANIDFSSIKLRSNIQRNLSLG